MNEIRNLENFLQTADSVQLRDHLVNHVVSVEAGQDAMRYLTGYRPAVACEVLCLMYGIAVYRSAGVFPDTPAAEADKWFVSVVVGSNFDNGKEIPLAETEQSAFSLAAQYLNLQNTFFGLKDDRIDDCLRGNVNIEGTTTGRITSSGLAESNVPKCA